VHIEQQTKSNLITLHNIMTQLQTGTYKPEANLHILKCP